jgi:Flp pilus assembly protein TadG
VSRLRTDESGTVVIWLLGLCVVLLFLGGLSVDLWRVLSERRTMAGLADAAAVAAATALDEPAFRTSGVLVLDPDVGRARALESLAGQPEAGALTAVAAQVTPTEATVVLEGAVPLTLMRILLPDRDAVVPLRVRSVAAPRPG